jgi:hypothetical protein
MTLNKRRIATRQSLEGYGSDQAGLVRRLLITLRAGYEQEARLIV